MLIADNNGMEKFRTIEDMEKAVREKGGAFDEALKKGMVHSVAVQEEEKRSKYHQRRRIKTAS